MENGPQLPHEKQQWEDATVDEVYRMIAENKLTQARIAAAMRIEILQGVCEDTDNAIEKNEGAITAEEWKVQKEHMQQEIREFEKIIQTIDTDTQDE